MVLFTRVPRSSRVSEVRLQDPASRVQSANHNGGTEGMPMKLTVATCQFPTSSDIRSNLRCVSRRIRAARLVRLTSVAALIEYDVARRAIAREHCGSGRSQDGRAVALYHNRPGRGLRGPVPHYSPNCREVKVSVLEDRCAVRSTMASRAAMRPSPGSRTFIGSGGSSTRSFHRSFFCCRCPGWRVPKPPRENKREASTWR